MAGMATITGTEIHAMVEHWLRIQVNGYLGSDYGQDIKALLQLPLADGAADAFLAKMREDIPALQALPAGALNLYSVETPPDRQDLIIEIAGRTFEVTGV